MCVELIEGPPGTGKTQFITDDAAKEVERVGKDKIIVSALTRTAAREATRRVDLPERQFGTCHSFAYRALGEPEIAEAHLKDWNENYPTMALTGRAHGRGNLEAPPDCALDNWDSGDKLALEYSRLRSLGAQPPWREGLAGFVKHWEDWKKQCGYLDFHDLLDYAYENVEKAPGEPAVIYCDERQDLSLAEARLLAKWGGFAERLVLVGDNHQAVFGWRGSDPIRTGNLWFNLGFMHRDMQNKVLEQSYRIPRAVHQIAMAQMKRCVPLKPVEYYPRDEEGSVIRAASYRSSDVLVRQARIFVDSGKTVMFLATCGYMLEPIIRALLDAGVPWHNPWRTSNGRWNPMQVTKGMSFIDRCRAFVLPSHAYHGDDARFWTVAEVKAWAQPLPAKGVFNTGMKTKLAKAPAHMSSVDLAENMAQWFTPAAKEAILQLDLNWYIQQIPDVDKKTSYKLIRNIAAKRGQDCLTQTPRVIVGTVHSLKGSEADVVYVCPDVSLAAAQAAQSSHLNKEEIQRLFYVAVTRARETLILCQPSSNLFVGF